MLDALIDKERDRAVGARFDKIEKQDERHEREHGGHRAAVHRAHQKIRRDDEIGKEHAHDHRQRADADGDHGHFLRFVFPVEKTRREHIRARCDNMHDDAVDPALGAHGKALNECGDQRDDESRSRAERKAADQNGNIRRVVFKERDRREDRKMDQRNKADGECRQDCHRRQFTGVCHGKGPLKKNSSEESHSPGAAQECKESLTASSSIQTILSVSELHRICLTARGLYRRSGISPCPEE